MFFCNKKCRIYTACGVSQTPICLYCLGALNGMDRAIIFGVRKRGIDCYLKYESKYEIIAFADNDSLLVGKTIFGKRIISPESILEEEFDRIIITTLFYFDTIHRQLRNLGIPEDSISDEFIGENRSAMRRWEFEQNRLSNLMGILADNYAEEEYEARFEKLKKEYKKIKLFMVYEKFLGEFLLRVGMILKYEQKEKGVFKVFLPCYLDSFVCNKELIKLLSKQVNLIYGEDLLFWRYVLNQKYMEVDLTDFTKYMLRDQWAPLKIGINEKFASIEGKRAEKSIEKLKEWGLEKDNYVCFGARTNQYLVQTDGSDGSFEFRNFPFCSYKLALEYLEKHNIKTVKVGRGEKPDNSLNSCVDYAGLYADDYMDLIVFSNCKFGVVTTSGIWHLFSIFGKPTLIVNASSFTNSAGGVPYTDYDLFIPKKYKNTLTNKYLSLREVIEIEEKCKNDGSSLMKYNVVLENNTHEEILAAVKEMLMRLEGRWEDNWQDEENYRIYENMINHRVIKGFVNQKYHSSLRNNDPIENVVEDMAYCFSEWQNERGANGAPIPCRIATTWLRNNPDFLL